MLEQSNRVLVLLNKNINTFYLYDNVVMGYRKTEFSLVNFKISHEDCWSRLGEQLPVKVHTIMAKPQITKSEILGLVEVRVERSDVFNKFLRRLSMEPSIDRIISSSSIANAHHHYKIMFIERYDRMLAGLFDEYMVLYKNTLISGGIENISIILPRSQVSELKQRLTSLGEIQYFSEKEVDEEKFLHFNMTLSESELKILKTAYEKGYYEMPKRCYLSDIARFTNLSKSTVDEHLRKAESKIISSEILHYL